MPRLYSVAVPRPVGIPQPVVYKVPYVKYEYEEVDEPCDPCCCGNKGNSGVSKIVNHTSVNWISGGKNLKSVKTMDSDDSSLEKENKPKTWGDVLEKFN